MGGKLEGRSGWRSELRAVAIDGNPLFDRLEPYSRILLAGAGGGFDVFSGLPLYFRLLERGHEVWLANVSFTDLPTNELEPMLEVTADSTGLRYFPEKYLCEWLDANIDHCSSVYAFRRTGVQPLYQAYQALVDELDLEAVVLVDGGTDALMRGDEHSLGTPTEDLTSVAAVNALDLEAKLLVCLGFGVDTFHGVCHHYFLEAVAELSRKGSYLGVFSLLGDHEEAELLNQAANYVFECMPENPSIVLSSILSAAQGRFGDHHSTERTAGSELYINPLMSLYWCFELEGVAARCLYLDDIWDTQSMNQVSQAILRFRGTISPRPWKELPV